MYAPFREFPPSLFPPQARWLQSSQLPCRVIPPLSPVAGGNNGTKLQYSSIGPTFPVKYSFVCVTSTRPDIQVRARPRT